jgi:hypothetical protein
MPLARLLVTGLAWSVLSVRPPGAEQREGHGLRRVCVGSTWAAAGLPSRRLGEARPRPGRLVRRGGRVVRQGPAKPRTPVRFRSPPRGDPGIVCTTRALSSGGERFLDTEEVRGSNPLAPTGKPAGQAGCLGIRLSTRTVQPGRSPGRDRCPRLHFRCRRDPSISTSCGTERRPRHVPPADRRGSSFGAVPWGERSSES